MMDRARFFERIFGIFARIETRGFPLEKGKGGTSKKGKDGLAETIKSRDQISARVSSGKCIPCSGRERYNVWIIKRAGSPPGG